MRDLPLQKDASIPGPYFKWTDEQLDIIKQSCNLLYQCKTWDELQEQKKKIAQEVSVKTNRSMGSVIDKMSDYHRSYRTLKAMERRQKK